MAKDKDPKQANPWYIEEKEGLAGEVGDIKRARPKDAGRPAEQGGKYKLDPDVNREMYSLDVEKRLSEGKSKSYDTNQTKPTLHDPEKFANLLKADSPSIKKITGSDIGSLKTSAKKSDAYDVRMKQAVSNLLNSVGSTLGGMFSKEDKQKRAQCKMYGHKPPEGGWQGLPICEDCGEQIKSREDLRKSTVIQPNEDMKP